MSAIGEALYTLRRWIYGDPPEPHVPPELREASHRLNNEAHELQCIVDRYKRSPDPFAELARTLRQENRRDH